MRTAQIPLQYDGHDDGAGTRLRQQANAAARDDAQPLVGLHDPVVVANLQQFIASIDRHFAAAATTTIDAPWRACDRRRRRC